MTVRNLNLVDSVHADILQRLRHGEIGPDDRLVDTGIAETYGISRMPAREALLRLVAGGYLVGSTRGYVLPRLSRDDIAGLFELRFQLEPRAAAAAARDLSEAAAEELGQAMESLRAAYAANDIRAALRANVAFRAAWVACVRNTHMAATISRFMDYFQPVRLDSLMDARGRETHLKTTQALHDALIARDPLAAQDRMTAFLFAAEEAFLAAHDRQAARQDAGPDQEGRRKSQSQHRRKP